MAASARIPESQKSQICGNPLLLWQRPTPPPLLVQHGTSIFDMEKGSCENAQVSSFFCQGAGRVERSSKTRSSTCSTRGAARAPSVSSSARLPLTAAAALPLPPGLVFLPGSGPQPRPVTAPQPGPATVPGGALEVEGRARAGVL